MRFALRVLCFLLSRFRRIFYRLISDKCVSGKYAGLSPVLACGRGKITFGTGVSIGIKEDAGFWNTYAFLNVRKEDSSITFGANTLIGNQFTVVSEGPGIEIGQDVLIGTGVSICDSDFHAIPVKERLHGVPKKGRVVIGNSVWIGDRVLILKGSEIGEGCVVAAGAVVSGKFPPDVLIGGVPAKIIRTLPENRT
ncbi:MAG: acyltransferase [Fibrobacter sp.]|jgi:maltose O-acetyltransferase|nr:acyltransferase [Fibrobacter sp.]